MVKKLVTFILLFALIDVLIISCCKRAVLYFTEINSIDIVNTNLREELLDSAIVEKENYRIKCNIDAKLISDIQNRFTFSSSLYATSCPENSFNGLKNNIKKLDIYCNKEILNIPAGSPLNINNKIRVYEFKFPDDEKNERLSISEWIDILNNDPIGRILYEMYFEFQESINNKEFLEFKFRFEFENGSILEFKTNEIKMM